LQDKGQTEMAILKKVEDRAKETQDKSTDEPTGNDSGQPLQGALLTSEQIIC
jgi:hypothetical protein